MIYLTGLKSTGKYTPPGFGNGPKTRWQNIQKIAQELDLGGDLLEHGLKRQVFLIRHSKNFSEAASGKELPVPYSIITSEWADYWLDRYCLPRFQRGVELLDGGDDVINSLNILSSNNT